MRLLLLIIAIFFLVDVSAQPFIEEIRAFRKTDSLVNTPKGKILFVGSSTFTKWKDVAIYFPGFPIVNRGFGGSSLTDVIRYVDDVIIRYAPKQIFIYCGENDFAANASLPVDSVVSRFKQLTAIIRSKLKPSVKIYYISMKPSVARWNMQAKFIAANQGIKEFISSQKNMQYIDLQAPMMDSTGERVRKDIFIQDNLHMNAIGYTIWQRVLAPYLMRL